MAVLLIPPTREETVTGFFWWRKREVKLTARVLEKTQTAGVAAGLVQSLCKEFHQRKAMHSIIIQVIGKKNSSLGVHRQLTAELANKEPVRQWLVEQLPTFVVSLEHLNEGPFKTFTYQTVEGKREADVAYGVLSSSAMEELEISVEKILPRVKHTSFDEISRSIKGVTEDDIPISEPLLADLCVSYAFEGEEAFQSVTKRNLVELDLAAGDLRKIALQNLKAQTNGFTIEDYDEFSRLIIGNDLEACLLLVDGIWEEFSADYSGDLILTVPTRDQIAFADEGVEGGIEALRKFSKRCMDREPAHQLTSNLLVRRGGAWHVYE